MFVAHTDSSAFTSFFPTNLFGKLISYHFCSSENFGKLNTAPPTNEWVFVASRLVIKNLPNFLGIFAQGIFLVVLIQNFPENKEM